MTNYKPVPQIFSTKSPGSLQTAGLVEWANIIAVSPPTFQHIQAIAMSFEKPVHNPYRSATYEISAHKLLQLPADEGYEVAFAGRSNAGKSSAINALTEQKSLARTSKTPGRTQQIIIFRLDEQRRIADLPGYGYAKVPAQLRAHWKHVMQRYFETRESLHGVVLVMDIRHPLRPFDRQMISWCEYRNVACHVLLTKADKLKRGPAQATLLSVSRYLHAGATAQTFSASKKQGKTQLIAQLNNWYKIGLKETDTTTGLSQDKINSRNTGSKP